jgi:tetratricopeptide (TPR) repeat protein
MTCKESMVTAPVIVLLYDTVFQAGSLRRALRTRGALYLGLAACWLVLVSLISSGPRSHSAGFSSGLSPWTYLLNQPGMILQYLQRSVLPIRLVFDYGLPRNLTVAAALPSVLAVSLMALAAVLAWRKNQPLAFLGAWFFITLAPASSIIPIATEVGAERRMYLPLAALAVLAAVALHRLIVNRTAATAVLVSVAVCFGILVVQRNAEYHDGLRLWQTVVDRYPHARARYNLGLELKAAGRRAEAIAAYQAAAVELPEAEYALGFESAADGDHARAVEHLRAYATARPDDVNVIRAYYLLGRSLMAMGKTDDAIAAFQWELRMQPGNPDAVFALGEAFLARERFAEAIAKFEEYTRLVPGDARAHFNLGFALASAGRDAEAVAAFRSAVKIDPRNPAFHANLGRSLARLGRVDEAIAEFQLVQQLEPDPAARAAMADIIKQLSQAPRRR